MTSTNQLTKEEWESLRRALEAAMNAVMIAHPGGTSQERLAKIQGWAELPNKFPRNEFVFGLVQAMPDELHQLNEKKSAHPGGNTEQTIADAVDLCKQAMILVRRNAPEEEDTFRQSVLFLANKIARAAKEGGFLGIGGQLVSPAEKAVIDRLTTAVQ